MRRGPFRSYSCSSAGTHPTEKRRDARMYQDFDHGLGRERTAQMRKEVEHNRLVARLARVARADQDSDAGRGRVARGAALVTALLFR